MKTFEEIYQESIPPLKNLEKIRSKYFFYRGIGIAGSQIIFLFLSIFLIFAF